MREGLVSTRGTTNIAIRQAVSKELFILRFSRVEPTIHWELVTLEPSTIDTPHSHGLYPSCLAHLLQL